MNDISADHSEQLARIAQSPKDKKLVAALLEGIPKDRHRSTLVELQRGTSALLEGVVLALLDLDENFDYAKVFPGTRSKHLNAPQLRTIGALWKSVSQASAINDDISGFTAADAKMFYILKSPDRVVLKYDSTSDVEIEYFKRIGIDHRALYDNIASFLTIDGAWQSTLASADFSTAAASLTVRRTEAYCGYQDRAIRNGTLHFADPFTGSVISASDSCLLFGRSCYLFLGKHPFYLICAGAGAKAMCLYIPKFNLIIDFNAGVSKFLSVGLFANTFSMLSVRFQKHVNRYNSMISQGPRKAQQPEIIITMQQAANPAHHLWNFFTGLERIILSGNVDHVSEVMFGGTEFYGPLSGLYPELRDVVKHGERSAIIDPYPFDPSKLVLTVGGYFIPRSLKERLQRTALEAGTGNYAPEDVKRLTDNRFPILWVGMRTGDKSWVDQQDGIAALADAVLEKYPSALVLLDGFSYPMGQDDVTHKWSAVRDELYAVGQNIRSKVASRESVINLVGSSLSDSILFANKTDVYFTPVGSSQHKVGWLSSAEGLVYSAPRGAGPLNLDRLPGSWEAEGSKRPEYMIGTPVKAGIRRGAGDRRAHLDNVSLDIADILTRLFDLIAIRAREGGHAAYA